jgi:hypothetical protein
VHLLTKIPPNILARLGLETAVAVVMTMDSGDRLRFTAKRVHVDMVPLGPLKSVRWAGEHNAPVFYDPARVESVRCFETMRRAQPPKLQPQAVEAPPADLPAYDPNKPLEVDWNAVKGMVENPPPHWDEPLELTEVYQPEEGLAQPTTAKDVHAAFAEHGVHDVADKLASVLAA